MFAYTVHSYSRGQTRQEKLRREITDAVKTYENQKIKLENISLNRNKYIEDRLLEGMTRDEMIECARLGTQETDEKWQLKYNKEAILASLQWYLGRVNIELNEHRSFKSMMKDVASLESKIDESKNKINQLEIDREQVDHDLRHYIRFRKYNSEKGKNELSELGVFPDMLKKLDNLEIYIDKFEKDLENLGQDIDNIKKGLDDLHESKEELESNIVSTVKDYLNKYDY